ncbi:hypothetical protein N7447_010283 [Penicillium robsamsonii]|uniref:uncharacterized protein n=1 Tax=Penicillium robsamsonii TaxID=1792511 RepID=UPI002549677B|nr:uncharacterized protein N7447_010283 [Penicillium robsamsonii]KAJ5810767.1 hypothetical protein N7447_010283 [Penicillium robsamsonii]
MAKATSKPNIDAAQMNQHLGYMIISCQETLEELDNATAKYRVAVDDPLPTPHCQYAVVPLARHFRAQVKTQLQRIIWDLRSNSFIKYREKLHSHTDSINLLLNTFIWSATDRIEVKGKYHTNMQNELLYETSQLNKSINQLVQSL